jgi:hypothetical protein
MCWIGVAVEKAGDHGSGRLAVRRPDSGHRFADVPLEKRAHNRSVVCDPFVDLDDAVGAGLRALMS